MINKQMIGKTCIGIALVGMMGCSALQKEKQVSVHPSKDQVVSFSIAIQDKERFFPTVADLLPETENIIYAEVVGLQYEYEGTGDVFTKTSWKVLENIRGDIQVGEIVEVYKDGGYISIDNLIKSYKNETIQSQMREEALQEMTEDQLSEQYSGYYPAGDSDPMVGDRSVLFLTKGWASAFPDDYVRIGGSEGEFIQVKDGRFFVTADMPSDQIRSLIEGATELPNGGILPTFYSLDEIKAMVAE